MDLKDSISFQQKLEGFVGPLLGIDLREERFQAYLENLDEIKQFVVAYPDQSRLNLCEAASANIPACKLQFYRQLGLRPTTSTTQFSNLRPCHVQKFHALAFWNRKTQGGVLLAGFLSPEQHAPHLRLAHDPT
jgi:hypothetical protein